MKLVPKSRKFTYKVKKMFPKDESEWVRVKDSHEAIISREEFDDVQELLKKDIRSAPNEETVYPFSGYVKCADCGQNMVRKKYRSGGKEYSYFICSTRKAGKGCSTHCIRADLLECAVLESVRRQVEEVEDLQRMTEILDSLPESRRNVFYYDAQVVKLKEEIERNENFRLKLYENLQEGLIGQDEYFLFKKSYTGKIASAEAAIHAVEEERTQAVERNRENLKWMDDFRRYQNLETLDRKAVVDLIEEIRVFEDKRIEVRFRYGAEYEKLMTQISDVSELQIAG